MVICTISSSAIDLGMTRDLVVLRLPQSDPQVALALQWLSLCVALD